jgi:glycosyltransferase involved in cell wall biosynthesis
VSEYYSNSDLFLFPSLLENYPIVLIEAMSHSLPALAFSKQKKGIRVANDEIITDGYNGLLADSEEDFEERMREILFKKKDINTLGRNARHTVLERNDWNTHIEKLESFFPPLQSSQCSNKGILEFD